MVDDLDAALDSVARGDVMPFPSLGDRLRETMPIAMQGQGPDYEADLQRAARATGVPIPSARSYPDVVKARARSEAIDYDRLAAETPATAGLLADLDKARIAHDDADNLTFIEKALNGLKKVPGTLKASYYDAANAGAQMRRMIDETSGLAFSPVTALIDAYVEAASPDLAQKLYRYDRERKKGDVAERAGFQRQAAEAMPEVDSFLEGALLSGVRSLPLTVSAIGASVATGSPGTGLALMGTTSASSSYGEARDAGLGVGRSLAYGLSQGTIEAGTEKLPLEFITKSLGKVKMGKFLGEFVVKEMAGEQVATVLQDMNDWHALNPDKSMGEYLSERPRRAAETAIATLVTAGALGPVHLAARVGARAAERRKQADESSADAQAMGELLDAAAQSKLRERDTDAFRAFIEQQTDGTTIGNTYIPAQAVAEYFQSQGVDWHSDAFFGAYSGQIDQGLATGGDVVIPTADVMAGLVGTDALTALRPAIRTSPDGMSLSEAEQFQNDYAAFLEQRGEEITAQAEAERAAQEPAQRVYDDVLEKMRSAGFTLDAARQYASLYAARYNARASRFETDAWTEYERSGVEIQQVLPEALAPIVQADQLDLVINALKGEKKGQTDRDRYGASLIEWIAERGGVEDIGGDLKAMGADNWQKAKPFRKRLLRSLPDARQGAIVGLPRDTRFSLDTIAHDAWERGYFPNLSERPTVAELLDAIGQELSGTPRYVVQDEARTATYDMRAAAEDLRLLLEESGVDWQNATRAQIRAAVDAFRAEVEGGYRQAPINTETPEFKRWFGDSKVVDESGKPLVVYHGTNQPIEAFSSGRLGMATRSESSKIGFFFTSSPRVAELYAENAGNIVVSNVEEFEARQEVLQNEVAKLEARAVRSGKQEDWQAYEAKMLEWETLEIDATREDSSVGGNILPVYVSIQNPRVVDFEGDGILKLGGGGFSQLIDEAKRAGYDGLILKNIDDAPSARVVSDHYVAFSPTQIKSVYNRGTFDPNDPRILYQEQRGSVQFSEGRALIQLFQSRDLSTFLHETGHLWLEELKFDATRENAPDALKADWETVKAWFAAHGHAVADDGTIPVEAHELWARGVERYTMEGKAPSSALRRAFDAFRSWLLSIYQVVDRLRAPITPEVREVMDRLIATDEELAQAREEQNLKALFTSAEQAGMTDAEFEAYQRTTVEARDEAYNELVYRTMAAIRRQRTQEWKDEERAVRAEVSQRVDARPEFRALRLLRTGKLTADAEPQRVKLDKEWLIQTYGADALQLLPKGVPPIYTDREATSADVVAELTGYQTGDELVLALMGLETRQQEMRAAGDKRSVRQQLIDEETAAEMRGRYGDPLNDGSIEEEALAAVHNERQGEIIASEVRTLTRRTREGRPTPYRLAREWARGVIQRSEVREATTGRAMQRYARAAAKASRAAEKAMLAGDIDETFRQKQAHLLNHALLVEAKAAADEVNKAVDRLGKIARRKTMKSVDQDYLEQAHGLLEQFDFRPLTAREIKERESFAEWAARQQANGIDVVAPQRLMNAAAQHYSKMSVEELAGLDATVKQILHLGRTKKKLLDAKEEREFDDIVDEAVASAAMLPPRPPSDLMEPSFWDAVKSGVASVDASLLKAETIFDWLDSKNPNGVFNRVVFRRIADAQDRRHAMMKEYTERLVDLLKAIPKPQIARWAERVTAPELFNRETGNPWVMTREQLVSIALNMGNASNADKLARGYGWSEDAVMAVLNRELSAADWQYVQGVWDTIESLWPEIAALERRVNGVEPEKVEARSLDTSAGALRGGYFPVVYDPTKSVEADMQAAAQGDALFENFYTRATTPKGFTKERTTVARPIHLSLGIINRHVSEVIHDITHREAIMDADRFLGDKRVMKAIDQSLGPEYRKQLRPWLQHVANEWAADREAGAGIDKFIKKLRTNTTIVGMGYRFSTMFMQIVGYSNSFEVVGVRWVADGVRRALQHPIESWRFVAERSGEAVQRVDTMDRDIRDNARQLAGRIDPLRAVKQYAFYGIGMMDRVVVTGTWIGAYNKALASGASEADAAYAADKAIRQSQGSGAAKDLARVQRGTGKAGEALKLLTMFYSYMSAFYQRERQLGRDIGEAVRERRPGDFPGLLMRAWWLFFVPAVLSELVAGREPDEDEDWGMWAFQKMLVSALGPIPVVRDIAGGIESGFGYKFTPASGFGQTLVNSVKDVQRILEGEETKRATRNAMEAVGYATGLIPGQIAATTQFFVDIAYGEQDPETLGDWYEGITKGKVKED